MTDTSVLEKFSHSQHLLMEKATSIESLFDRMKYSGITRVRGLRNKMVDDHLRVVVLGSFKRGKSTFINSLLGDEILPNFATPCTAVINEIKWGEEKKAVVHFQQPGPKISLKKTAYANLPPRVKDYLCRNSHSHIEPLEIGINELEDYVVIRDPGNCGASSINDLPYDHVEIYWPLQLLKNGVVIIDSPGLDECESRTEITRRYLENADAILFVMSCSALAGKSEMDFIDNVLLANGYEDMLFICNRFDEVREKERDRIKAYARQKLGSKTGFGSENGICFLSAAKALEGRIHNDSKMVEESGVPELERRLYSILVDTRGRTKLLQPARIMNRELHLFTNASISDKALKLEEKEKLVLHINEFLNIRKSLIQEIKKSIDTVLKMFFNINLHIKNELQLQYDAFIENANVSVNNYTPNSSIGLSFMFSNSIERRKRISEVANSMQPDIENTIMYHQSQFNNIAIPNLFEEGRKLIKYYLSLSLNDVIEYDRIMKSILYPNQLDQGELLKQMSFAFEEIKNEAREQNSLQQQNPYENQTTMYEFQMQVQDEQNEISDIDLTTIPNISNIQSQILPDITLIIEKLFPNTQQANYLNLHCWESAAKMLENYGFDYSDPSKTTNDIKQIIKSCYLYYFKENKNLYITELCNGWDDQITEFAKVVRSFVNEQVEKYDKQADEQYTQLVQTDHISHMFDSAMNESNTLREQVEEIVYDLIS